MRRRSAIIAGACAMALPLASRAEPAWPARAIRLVFPFPAGGGGDAVARLIGNSLQKQFGQPIVVENRSGANGRLGTEQVLRSHPDGYTLLITAAGPITIAPLLEKLPYDPFKDLTPVSLATTNDAVLVVNKSFPAANLKEFLAEVRRSPGKYSFGTAGTGGAGHLAGELLKAEAQLQMTHIPYRGDAPAVNDLIADHVPICVNAISTALPYIRAGQIRPIASFGASRFPALPEVQTFQEAGFKNLQAGTWLGVFAPAGTPDELVKRVAHAIQAAIAEPEMRERLIENGNTPVASSPEDLRKFIMDEHRRYAQIIKSANIRMQ